MGAVFLAYDTLCGRYIALKRIKSNLTKHQIIRERFLRESRLTSQLAHPTIIPIYAIHCEESEIYYTMPYVAGETFKQLLKEAKKQLREEGETDTGLSNIYSLLRIFLSICQGVSYAHSRGVLHRDLKPENIMIGQYGEVFILDWGLAHLLASEEQAASASDEKLLLCDGKETEMEAAAQGLTVVGKILGTVAYLAPERALGKPASIQTDIYALGVILYQILTLKMPFKRGTIAEFRKTVHLENFIDPSVVAPYGDVPRILCRVVKKCLEPQPEDRYQKVEQLIQDVATFTEGHSEWFALSHLNRDVKSDWQFQEHILWTQYAAIARSI
jgi:serine/threonine-protein kinase